MWKYGLSAGVAMAVTTGAAAQDCPNSGCSCLQNERTTAGEAAVGWQIKDAGTTLPYRATAVHMKRRSEVCAWEQIIGVAGGTECPGSTPVGCGDSDVSQFSGAAAGSVSNSLEADPPCHLGYSGSAAQTAGLMPVNGGVEGVGMSLSSIASYQCGASISTTNNGIDIKWSYAQAKNDATTELSLERVSPSISYNDQVRIGIVGNLVLDSRNYNYHHCSPYAVSPKALRAFVRIRVTALNSEGESYWRFTRQSVARVGSSGQITGPSGWLSPHGVLSSVPSECRDTLTGGLLMSGVDSYLSVADSSSCDGNAGDCATSGPTCSDFTLCIPGEPAALRIEQSAWTLNIETVEAFGEGACPVSAFRGDANESGLVRPADRDLIVSLDGVVLGGAGSDSYMPLADVDADGDIDSDDLDSFDASVCLADFNSDGYADILDFLDFMDAYGNSDVLADMDENEEIDILDLLLFMDVYGNGC